MIYEVSKPIAHLPGCGLPVERVVHPICWIGRPILQRIGGRVAWSFYPVALLPVRKLGSHCAPTLILTVLASKYLWNPLVEVNQLGSGGVKEELRRYWSELKCSFAGSPERGRELRVVFLSL